MLVAAKGRLPHPDRQAPFSAGLAPIGMLADPPNPAYAALRVGGCRHKSGPADRQTSYRVISVRSARVYTLQAWSRRRRAPMSRQVDALRRKVRRGALVPSPTPREFTIAVGPSAAPPRQGDIWVLAGESYLVSEVHGVGSIRVGKLRRLIEPGGIPGSST